MSFLLHVRVDKMLSRIYSELENGRGRPDHSFTSPAVKRFARRSKARSEPKTYDSTRA